ncbi:MAG: amidase [Sphingomonadales bacterium]|nr:amidase [Sphingomonadales bacterium]
MATFAEYTDYDAIGLAELIRSRAVSRREVFDAACAQIEQYNSDVNAVVFDWIEGAGARLERGSAKGPLAGVPFLLKASAVYCQGTPTTAASRFIAPAPADHDSHFVTACRDAGLVILGKTNLPEFGLNATTEPMLYGATRNPWDTGRTAGGSSGGAGAAVACRMAPVAHGTDGAGSIRIPASANGVFGFKPTRGLTPCGPHAGELWSGLACNHVLTRSVRDSAAVLDVCHGPWPGDPYSAPTPARPFLDQAGRPPDRLRIGFSAETPHGTDTHPECVTAVEDAAALCSSLGHEVIEAALPFDMEAAVAALRVIWASHVSLTIRSHNALVGRPPDYGTGLETVTAALANEARSYTCTDHAAAVAHVHKVGRDLAAAFELFGVFLSPTMSRPPWPLGTPSMMSANLDGYLEELFDLCAFTPQFNMSGQPAMSVPLHWSADGLPVGVQFAARFGEDAALFRLAGQLETARPWADRRPGLLDAAAA